MNKIKMLFQLFLIFFKIGSFTFGGGLAMLPLIQKEVVDKQKWVKEDEIIDIFAMSQSIPGVIAVNSAIFIGNRVTGFLGAVAAVLGVVLPAFISILLVISILTGLKGNIYVEKAFTGIRAASAALILLAGIKLGKSSVKGKFGYIIMLASLLAIVIFNINALWAIVFGGVSGFGLYLHSRRKK